MSFLSFLRQNFTWLLAGALLTFTSSFGQTYFISIFAGEIRAEYGLSHGQWGGIYSLGTFASAIVMIWAGALTDTFRVRTLAIYVLFILAVACLFLAFLPAVWMLPLAIFLLRFAGQGMTSHIATVAMARWFVAARGRALSIASLGFALGEALMPLLFVALLAITAWQNLWIASALFVVCVIPLLTWLLKSERTPTSVSEETQAVGMSGLYWTRNMMLKHWLFWALFPAILGPSAFGTAFFFQQVHLAEIKGWSHVEVVALFPIYTIAATVSALATGWALDRFGTWRLMPVFQLPFALGFILFAMSESLGAAVIAIAFLGISSGANATLPSAFWADYYGTKHLGSIKAMATAVMVLGSAVGPGITGYMIDAGIGFESQMAGFAVYFVLASALLTPFVLRATKLLATSS